MSEHSVEPKLPGIEPARNWLAETVRITAFQSPSGLSSTPKNWKEIFDAESDQVLRQPGQPRFESGLINELRYFISQAHDRFDIGVMPESVRGTIPSPLNIGSFSAAMKPLIGRCDKIFHSTDSFARLAAGGVQLLPVESARDGARILTTIVSQLHNMPENAQDIALQMNWPISGDDLVPGLIINRLVRWQIVAVQVLGLGFGSTIGGPAVQMPIGERHTVIRVEIDINTSPEGPVPIRGPHATPIMTKLASIACEIADLGGFS